MREDPLQILTHELADLGRRARAASTEMPMDDELFVELRNARVRRRAALAGKGLAIAACLILGATIISAVLAINARNSAPHHHHEPPRAAAPSTPASDPSQAAQNSSIAELNRVNAQTVSPAPGLEQLNLPEARPVQPQTGDPTHSPPPPHSSQPRRNMKLSTTTPPQHAVRSVYAWP
ncbi:MAG: hypothetical protein K2X32_02120 [Phycisphaerales bacterium]|nr:hypothetical protein [Phycisphaerales bacterium]